MGKHFTAWEKAEIEKMNKAGSSHREIGERLGYSRMQVKEYFHRLYRKERADPDLMPPNRKGRPRKTPLTTERGKELRIWELEREVELLRSFLHVCGRR
jgi:predicted ArsR family transcriptional regulator